MLSDLLKGLAWPVAVAVVAFVFRHELIRVVPRITSVGPNGIVMAPSDQNSKVPESLDSTKLSANRMEPLVDPMAIEIESKNRELLETMRVEDREDRLLRSLTFEQMNKSFGIAYANIFGSQIGFLKSRNSLPISRQDAEIYFNNVKAAYPSLEGWSLDQYLQFLLSWRFIEENHGMLSITMTGRSFLQFIVAHGLSENRLN